MASATRPTASGSRRSAGSDQRSCVVLTRNGDLDRCRLAFGRQDDERDEGEEPGQVQVEPVRQHELEADQQERRERGQLADALSSRYEVDGDRGDYEQHLKGSLD